ncbi:unnamed protein product [Closterium sp. NIES-65]|nr:unnamed protein product [Closterium sp. NIES-65]
MDLENIEFSLEDQMEHAVSVLATRARKKGLTLVSWLKSPDMPEVLLGDPGRLLQIFINLVGNGIKFTDKGEVLLSAILVSASDRVAEVLFAVKDTGIGIPQAKQSLLFQAFSQVHASDSRLYGGTGLGLMISSRLANAMGGHMWVESEEGQGSTFFFTAKFSIPAKIVPSQKLKLDVKADEAADAISALEKLQRALYDELPYTLLIVDLKVGDGDNSPRSSPVDCKWLLNHVKGQSLLRLDKSGCRFQNGANRSSAVQDIEDFAEPLTPDSLFSREGNKAFSEVPHFRHRQQSKTGAGFADLRANREVMQMQECSQASLSSSTDGPQESARDEVLPVVLLTPGSTDDKSLCKDLGVTYYAPKPVKREVLVRRVKQAEHLPLHDRLSTTNSATSDEVAAAAASDKSLKVLVAEDNIVNQRVALTLLRKWGHEAVLASNGEEAVKKVQTDEFDVILMDVQMPVCDGLQATKRIRDYESTKNHHTPIIAMTAQALIGDGMKCIDAGMDSYMSKPLNASKLNDLLRLVCRSHALPKPTNESTREF